MEKGYFYGQYEYFIHRKSATNSDIYEGTFEEVFEKTVDEVLRHTGDCADYEKIKFKDGIAEVSLTIDRIDAEYKGDLAGLADYMNEVFYEVRNNADGCYNDYTSVMFTYSANKAYTKEQMIEKLLEAGLFTEAGNELYTFNPTWFSK